MGKGCLTDEQRAELRAIIAAEYRGTLRYGESLLLDGFIADLKPKPTTAAIEFDFLPDPRASAEPEPVPFVIPAKPDPVTTMVGYLMANRGVAADVFDFLQLMPAYYRARLKPGEAMNSVIANLCAAADKLIQDVRSINKG